MNFLLAFMMILMFFSFGCGSVVENATVSGNGSIVQTPTNCKSGVFSFSYQNGNLNGSFCDDGKIHVLNATGVALTGNVNSTEINNYLISQGFSNTSGSNIYNGCYDEPKWANLTCYNNSFVSSNSWVVNETLNNTTVIDTSYGFVVHNPNATSENATLENPLYFPIHNLSNCYYNGEIQNPENCTYTVAQ